MVVMMSKPYKPRKGCFPYLIVEYLYENGESKARDIRREIGLDAWAKYSFYPDRSSYQFSFLIIKLMGKGLVEKTKRGYYRLTPSYKFQS